MTGKIKTVVFAEGVEVTPSSYIDIVDADGVQTLTNKNLSDSTTNIVDVSDATKKIGFDAGGTTGTKTTIAASQTANRTVTLPDQTTTLVGRATTDTLENKTLTSPQVNSGVLLTPNIDDYFDINEEAEPSSPSSGKVRVFAKNDKKVYKKDSNGAVTEIGSGGAGGINYISNYDAETGTTTGWATYADAAATTPVDGTGGSPNITFTASTSSPLRGTYNFLITKDAANRQGQGVSYDFTIAAADKGLPLGISWEGEASANYTGSSGSEYLVCYIYDVTNATLIATSNVNIAPGSSKGFTTFLATTSTSYRLIFHVAGTGTAAWTYKLDTVKVSPEIAVQGAAVTDWQQWTPTFAGCGTVTTDKMFWRRNGDSIEIAGNFTTGTPSAATATFTLPNSLTNATDKRSSVSNPRAGRWQRNSSTGSNRKAGTLLTDAAGSNFVYFGSDDYTAAVSPASGLLGNALFGNSEVIWVDNCVIPITNWASNVTMANRAVEEYLYNSGASTSASDTSSFAYGAAGTAILSFTSNSTGAIARRVRSTQPILPTDKVFVELQRTSYGNTWFDAQGYVPWTIASTARYGIGWDFVSGSNTDIDVYFGKSGATSASTYGATAGADAWSGYTSINWRVRIVRGGAVVGYPVGARNIVGDTTGTTVPTGYLGERLSTSRLASAATGMTTNTTLNVTSAGKITLTPGVWSISAMVGFQAAATTSITYMDAAISKTSATLPASDTESVMTSGEVRIHWQQAAAVNGGGNQNLTIPPDTFVVTTNTDIYLVARAGFTVSTLSVFGSLWATRIA